MCKKMLQKGKKWCRKGERKGVCECSSMVERKLPKLKTRVQFPSLAPRKKPSEKGRFFYGREGSGREPEQRVRSRSVSAVDVLRTVRALRGRGVIAEHSLHSLQEYAICIKCFRYARLRYKSTSICYSFIKMISVSFPLHH